ncbi:MAG TPA: hypothetical protein DCE41_14195 [Cytophagales bacterium]|nr:hypothetical protein [Cytophagales bacterium]HAA23492.1 hypothetical protein [Cytophagales bacterium]
MEELASGLFGAIVFSYWLESPTFYLPNMARTLLTVTLLLALQVARGQAQQDIAALLEERLPWADAETASEAQLDAWIQALSHPIDINRATYQELEVLQVLTPNQIEALLTHREQFGALVSLYELQAVSGWNLVLIEQVLPFLTLSPAPKDGQSIWQRLRKEDNRYFLLRYDSQWPRMEDGMDSTGSNGRWLARLRVSQTRDFSLGVTLEQDAGEPIGIDLPRAQLGPDFASAHMLGYGKGGWVKRWVVGDYQVHWGQGLTTAAGFTPGKGGETILNTRRPLRGIVPYTSSVESGYLRGGAITLGTGNWEATLLASFQARDASVQHDSIGPHHFTAFRSAGYHRTESERAGYHALRETTLGGKIQYQGRYQREILGAYVMYHRWNLPWEPRLRPDNPTVFRGQELPIPGIFGQVRRNNWLLFGEAAWSNFSKPAALLGVQLHLTPQWQTTWLLRHYDPGFTTLYGDAFAEGSQPRNEQGLYWGLAYQPSKRWRVTAYYDRFTFPWLRFQTAAPSQGYEFLIRALWRPHRHLDGTLQFRREVKDRTTSTDAGRIVAPGTKDNALFQINYRPEGALGLRLRVQGSRFQIANQDSYGVALLYDGFYRYRSWQATGRVALFHAPDFDNRQYVYENHVLYAFSLPAYYGQGLRTYLNLRWKALPSLTLETRWARTFVRETNPTEAPTPPVQSLTLQVQYAF